MQKFMMVCLSLFLLPLAADGQVCSTAICNAVDCMQANVLAALPSSGNSNATVVVNIPACSGGIGWSSPISYTVNAAQTSLSILGAGNLLTTGGGDQTVLVDNYASSNPILTITTSSSSSYFRLAGITSEGGSGLVKYGGVVVIAGNSHNVRVDHDHFSTTTYSPANASNDIAIEGCVYGVMDHSIVDAPVASVNNGIHTFQGSCNADALGVGDQAWAAATELSGPNFFFIEDSIFNNGAGNDCTYGGRFVWRYNTMNMTAPAPSVQTHPTAGQRTRGCRAWQIYHNNFIAQPSNYLSALFFLSSGTGVIWGNSTNSSSVGGGTGYANLVGGYSMRADNTTYTETATPNGWGYCGTAFNGTGSGWDQNTSASTGYACLDGIGRGIGQLLVGSFPSVLNNSTSTLAWPNQALEPVYEWADAYSPVPSNPSHIWSEAESPLRVVQNQDYYLGTTDAGVPITFTCATGVGAGLLSARPSAGGCTNGVGYWATDQNTLYVMSSGSWVSYYTPYIHPHPLDVQGTPPTPAPAPQSFVQFQHSYPVPQPPVPPVGNWQGLFGTDGYWLANSTKSLPTYAAVIPMNALTWTWASSTSDTRGLAGPTRIASCWYNNPAFYFDVNLTDGNQHLVTIYFVDWDTTARAETVTVTDAVTNAVLDTRKVSAFNAGEYLTWSVCGHVHINLTRTAGANAVASAILFG